MKKILLTIGLFFAIGQAFAQGAKQPLPAAAPMESLKPGEWVWYAETVPEGPMLLMVSISQQKAYLYRNGARIAATTVSTGKKGHETPTGVFTILQKNKDHKSSLYKDGKNNPAAMPYMQRLTWDGIALHSGNLPGYPASHGCVRMPDGFSRRLFSETELGMTVIVSSDKVSNPKNMIDQSIFAQSMDAKGKAVAVEPLSVYEDYRWQPEKSLFGPVTVLISTKNQLAITLRNGIEIGRSKIGVIGKQSFGSQAYVVLDGVSAIKSRIAPDQMELNWLRIYIPGGVEPTVKNGLDSETIRRIVVPVDFAKLVYSELKTGSTMLLTDEDINLDNASTGMTVLSDETDAEHEVESE